MIETVGVISPTAISISFCRVAKHETKVSRLLEACWQVAKRGRTGCKVRAFFQGANGRARLGAEALIGMRRWVTSVGSGVPM